MNRVSFWERHDIVPSYLGTTLARGSLQNDMVREAQLHLRATGYLGKGIDGNFGSGTEMAVRSLQFDLIYGNYTAKGAPVSIQSYNRGRLNRVSGILDSNTANCILDMLNDRQFVLLPYSEDPASENAKISQIKSNLVPMPFLRVILKQESGARQFEVPTQKDEDAFIVVGLDRNDSGHSEHITSRGYGAGQYTLFHHPPALEEVNDFMLSVEGNVAKAAEELRGKFDKFVNGKTSGTRADDRIAEFGKGPLRLCKYRSDDPRYLNDCQKCMVDAGETDIVAGVTPLHRNTDAIYKTTRYHKKKLLEDVPIRHNIGCDWPYAIRRYNGSGVNSYWYQSKVLMSMR